MKQYLYAISPKDDAETDFVVSDMSENDALEWYVNFVGDDLEEYKIKELKGEDLDKFYIFDPDDIVENEDGTKSNRIECRGVEVFKYAEQGTSIVASTCY